MSDDAGKPDGSAWTADERRRNEARLGSLDAIAEMAETFEGMAQGLIRNGWTDSQARAIVAWQFGWRPADGSKPDGADRGGFS